MEFRLLGPVEVVRDGVPFDIAAPRQEIVLAMLLLEANRVVSVSRLVDALWDDEPPRTAKSQVQICVSALRRLLATPDGAELITTRSQGYVIQISDDALDLKRFEEFAAKGAAAGNEQRFAEAAHYLRSALALWRGPAMAGIESRIIQVAATRWNESRLAIMDDCLEFELRLGRHRELIAELTELVAEHPLRERFRAQLMLALYRSGRQAEALEVFRVGREILLEELGLDPGEELRWLERAILASDRSLEVPEGVHRGTMRDRYGATPAPHQLPAAAPDFTGREDLLEEVCTLLSPVEATDGMRPVPVVVLTGKGGIGKTALALRAAHLLKDSYPDGQLFAQLYSGDLWPESPNRLLERFLRSFGIAPSALPEGLDDRAAMYRSWLAERRTLIVIDDATSLSQVRPLLPGTPNCAMMITTRSRLSGLEGAHQLEIGVLDESSGMDLLARVIGTGRARAEEESVRAMVRLCGHLPLAIRIAGAKLAARPHWRVGQMIHRLEDEKQRLDELDFDGISIRATLSLSFEYLEKDCRRLLLRLGMLGATDFSSWVCAPLLDCVASDAEELLEYLVEARLVEAQVAEDGWVRYHLHDLVRIYAAEQLADEESTETRASVQRRLLGCWLSLAAEAHRREYGGNFSVLHGAAAHWCLPDDTVDTLLSDPIGWFQREHSALVAAIFQAGQAGLDELCWDLAMTSVTLFQSGSHIDDWRKTHEYALTVVRDAGNRRGEAAILYSLGTLALTGRSDDAARDLGLSLELFDSLEDVHGRGLAIGGLAFLNRLGGEYDTALTRYQMAIAAFQQVGDLVGEAHMLKDMARIHMEWERYDTAGEMLEKALAICRNVGARRAATQVEYELAELYLRRDQLKKAEKTLESIRLTAHEGGDIVGYAYALLGLGITRVKWGDFAQAEAHLRTALDVTNHAGDLLIHGRVLLALAERDIAVGHVETAAERLNEAIDVLDDLGSAAVWRARVLEVMGILHERAGRFDAARRAWRAAMELSGEADPILAARLTAALAGSPVGVDESAD